MASLLPTPEPPDPVEGQLGHFEHSNWVKASLKALDQGTVHVVNGVAEALTVQSLTVDDTTEDALIKLRGGQTRGVIGYNAAGTPRWRLLLGDSTGETGNNSGSLFSLLAYGDDGSVRSTVLQADRNSGLLTVAADPTAALGIATKQYADTAVPLGAIIAFGGQVAPTGWHLCDGTGHGSAALQAMLGSANTPDLRGLFIVGAGANTDTALAPTNYAIGVGSKSGKETVTLTAAQSGVPAHNHAGVRTTTEFMDRSNVHSHVQHAETWMNLPGNRMEAHAGGVWLNTETQGGRPAANTSSVDINHAHGFTPSVAANAAAPAASAHENRPPYYALVYIIKKV